MVMGVSLKLAPPLDVRSRSRFQCLQTIRKTVARCGGSDISNGPDVWVRSQEQAIEDLIRLALLLLPLEAFENRFDDEVANRPVLFVAEGLRTYNRGVMIDRTRWLILAFMCGLLLLVGCSRVTEMDAVVTYTPFPGEEDWTLVRHVFEEILGKAIQDVSPEEWRALLGDLHSLNPQLGWISIHNPSQRDWVGVGVVLTSPNSKRDVEPYMSRQRIGGREVLVQINTAPVLPRSDGLPNRNVGLARYLHCSRSSSQD